MAGDRILVPIDDLKVTSDQLTAIITELESAASKQDNVEQAVGSPYGDSRLKDRCHDFEGSWNDSRDKLLTKLSEVASRVKGTVDEVQKQDAEIAASMEQSGSGGTPPGRQPAAV
ncbi:MAG: hypothetical protein WAK00_10170 [Microbacterium sp.]|uniref:hypothetical protein n=1 Tax=Microbacterium sp. TaxID=51671 RepID=UPI003BAF65D9